jgi:hypothetical protein
MHFCNKSLAADFPACCGAQVARLMAKQSLFAKGAKGEQDEKTINVDTVGGFIWFCWSRDRGKGQYCWRSWHTTNPGSNWPAK